MIRKFIPLDKIKIYDEFHMKDGDSFTVNQKLDGNTTEYHKEGIEIIKGVIQKGTKILPIIVYEDPDKDQTYKLLDGFKRCRSNIELGNENIEAFVFDIGEYNTRKVVYFHGKLMRAYKGGQNYEVFGLLEGNEQKNFNYEDIKFLYNSPDPHGLKIEVSECVHVHWGEYGKYRLALGRRDFIELAKAISKIDGQD